MPRLDTAGAPLLQIASLHILSRSSRSGVFIWRPQLSQFGVCTDESAKKSLINFCSDAKTATCSELYRTRQDLLFRACKLGSLSKLGFRLEMNGFKRPLVERLGFLSAAFYPYFTKYADPMARPRMFEIEKILGSRGIADVVDGNRYDFQIFYLGFYLVAMNSCCMMASLCRIKMILPQSFYRLEVLDHTNSN